jgi:hypothetical protein
MGAGRPVDTIKAIDPTMRQQLADFLQAGFERLGASRNTARKNAQTLVGGGSSNLPIGMGLADIVPFLGTALQTEEAAIAGGEAVEAVKRGDLGEAGVQAGMAAVGMIPGAVGTVKGVRAAAKGAKALAPKAGEMADKYMGRMGLKLFAAPEDYRGSHRAPMRSDDVAAPGFDMTVIMPDDIYSAKAAQLYGHTGGNDPMDKNTARLIKMMRGKPDMDVMVFRAVPSDVKSADINRGDWITINRDYAEMHGERVLRGKYKIVSKMVKAKDIYTDGNSIHEWGYDPAPKGAQ